MLGGGSGGVLALLQCKCNCCAIGKSSGAERDKTSSDTTSKKTIGGLSFKTRTRRRNGDALTAVVL
jgi:hypothetical protein